jgi:DNA-binding response OmpR family regulator
MVSSILVVDDDTLIRELVKDSLAPEGYSFIEASDGRQALIAFDRDRPDMVILDLLMPEQSGVETLTEIRRRSPSMGVIVLSSMDTPTLIEEALRAGASKFIAKPFHPIEMLDAVRQLSAMKNQEQSS